MTGTDTVKPGAVRRLAWVCQSLKTATAICCGSVEMDVRFETGIKFGVPSDAWVPTRYATRGARRRCAFRASLIGNRGGGPESYDLFVQIISGWQRGEPSQLQCFLKPRERLSRLWEPLTPQYREDWLQCFSGAGRAIKMKSRLSLIDPRQGKGYRPCICGCGGCIQRDDAACFAFYVLPPSEVGGTSSHCSNAVVRSERQIPHQTRAVRHTRRLVRARPRRCGQR
jgi:hypothetical protein